MRRVALIVIFLVAVVSNVLAAPTISNINLVVTCNTSVLINFYTNVPAHAYIEYGLTTSYGSQTIDDTVRYYTEHAIQLTGLSSNTLYHYRIVAIGGGTTTGSDQTFTTASSGTSCPALPSQVDSRMPDMTGATEETVKTSGGTYTPAQFQTALNAARDATGKRIITVDAGLTMTGQFTLGNKVDSNWIIVRSSAHASLPEGKRVFPADSSNMFRIRNTSVDPAIVAAATAHHWRFIGMELTIDPAALADAPAGNQQNGLAQFQINATSQATLSHHIGFDRCYIHGLPTKNTNRGIYGSFEDSFIIDSYFDDFHSAGSDSQAILFTTVGRAKVLNNTIIGAGENFMWGGASVDFSGYVVGSLEWLHNHHYWPLSWKTDDPSYGGWDWIKKNLFELKTSAKMLIFGNLMGGSTASQGGWWFSDQSSPWVIKLEQNSGALACDLCEDLIIYKNLTKNVGHGFSVVGRTNSGGSCVNTPQRLWVTENLFEVDATTWGTETGATAAFDNASGWTLSDTDYLQVTHNTTINATPTQGPSCDLSGGTIYTNGKFLHVNDIAAPLEPGFVFKDNIVDYRGCGLVGGGFNGSNPIGSLDGKFTGWVFTKNGIMRTGGDPGGFPAGNYWVTSWSPQLVNFNGGVGGNYRVAASSTWHNASSDAVPRDIGADIDAIERATESSADGDWPTTASSTDPTRIRGRSSVRGRIVIRP